LPHGTHCHLTVNHFKGRGAIISKQASRKPTAANIEDNNPENAAFEGARELILQVALWILQSD